MFTGMRGLALAVLVAEARLGGKRGDRTRATHDLAKQRGIAYATLKRAVSRYRHLRAFAAGEAAMLATGNELRRRMSGMPDDVRAALLDCEGAALLAFLRAHEIDGTCPQWLIDAVHSDADLLSPK